jgi:hypothetical protein
MQVSLSVIVLTVLLDDKQIALLWRKPGIIDELEKQRLDRYVYHRRWHDLLGDPQNLKSIPDEKLKDFFDEYYGKGAGRHTFVNIHKARIIMDVKQFRSMLIFLLDDKKDIVRRMNEVLEGRYHIHGVGKALVTSFLLDFNPSKYAIWNDVVTRALVALGRAPKKETGESVGRTYAKILRETRKIRHLAPSQYRNYLDVDLFYYIVTDERIGRRALRNTLEMQLPELADVGPAFIDVNKAFSRTRRRAALNVFSLAEGRDIDRESARRAEEIVLDQEREKLKKAGRPELARRVRDVSSFARLGYDIESFAENGRVIQIEVKSTKAKKLSGFYLTSSEWLAAKNYGKTYELHIVLQPHTLAPRITKIRDVSHMVRAGRFMLEPSQYFAFLSRSSPRTQMG